MRRSFILSLLFILVVSLLHGATYRVPVMVLPFENKTDVKQLDRFTSWIKAELKNYDNIRLIEFYKSTNVNGTLLLFMKPSQSNPFGKKNAVGVTPNIPDTYYIITGTITYTDYRYNIHADVINSSTEWVIAKDDVYITGLENVRTLLTKELGKRLSLKMSFKRVETFNEKKVLSQAATTNQYGEQTNLTAAQQSSSQGAQNTVPNPNEQQNLFNEKKQILIVYNTNEKKVLEELQKNKTNTAKPLVNKPSDKKVQLDGNKPEIKFYSSPFEHEISFQPIISGDFKANSNAIFTSYELGYKYQIIPSLFIGLNLGAGLFDVKGSDSGIDYKYNIFEFRFMPNILYRWFFIQPFFLDAQIGGGAYFGNATYAETGSDTLTDGLNGFLVQGKIGAGIEVKRLIFAIHFAIEWQMVNYTDRNWTFNVTMTTIGLSAGFQF